MCRSSLPPASATRSPSAVSSSRRRSTAWTRSSVTSSCRGARSTPRSRGPRTSSRSSSWGRMQHRPRWRASETSWPSIPGTVMRQRGGLRHLAGRGARQAPQPALRPARALCRRQPVRDDQHPRPVDLRANARARNAAGRGHDSPPGTTDGAARERDHRADRRSARDCPSGSLWPRSSPARSPIRGWSSACPSVISRCSRPSPSSPVSWPRSRRPGEPDA